MTEQSEPQEQESPSDGAEVERAALVRKLAEEIAEQDRELLDRLK
ncbi:hypothetical protein [Yinghuangia seranimata]|nr:hypothetical protein [Yinghuangia seranimata]MDI2128273.1 hypothetical protein [Yinghuangia seranimata]